MDSQVNAPDWLEPLDHTADAGFTVTAPDLPELFSRAAWAMFDLICDLRSVEPSQDFQIDLTAPDLPALLVHWLSELNFRHVTEGVLFSRFEAVVETDPVFACHARIGGEAIQAGKHTVFTEIKAVTYHGLLLEPADEGWKAQVIFDL